MICQAPNPVGLPVGVSCQVLSQATCQVPLRAARQVANQVSSQVHLKVFSVDTEKFPHVGSRFQVAALPCLVLVQNGEPVLRLEGVVKADKVIEQVQTIVSSSTATATTA